MNSQLIFRFCLTLMSSLFLCVRIIAQTPSFQIHQQITVVEQGDTLKNPWAGGLNASQFNTMDLNGDSNPDLVIFDRTNNKLSTFLNLEKQYIYAPEYEPLFPETTFWVLLRDFNADGKKDLFTSAPNGIRVYRNATEGAGLLKWVLFKDPIETLGFSGTDINLKIDVTDIPSITDLDNDGDLDVLNFVPSVGGTTEYHQNLSMERYGIPDSLVFEKITSRWGGFEECGTCNTYFFNESAACRTAKIEHAGSALLALDLDGDDDKELLLGEISCSNLVAFNNQGTSDTALFNDAILNYPPSSPVDIQIFPAPFYEDVDFDGIPDLLASPNLFFNEGDLVDFVASNWYYKNLGTVNNPDFALQQKDFLQKGMIDLGEFTVPAVADVNGDGNLDILVSNRGKLTREGKFEATIHLFINNGTNEMPSFNLANDDYLNFSTREIIELKIDLADLNGDGSDDLYYTFREKNSSETQLQYLLNQTTQGLDFSGAATNSVSIDLRPRDEAHFVDVDLDGDMDLLIGKFQSGQLQWHENTGNMNFTLRNQNLGNFDGGIRKNELSIETADFTGDGELDLMLGNWSGILRFIPDFQSKLTQNFEPITDFIEAPLLEGHRAHQWGSGIFPTAFGNNLLLGTAGGGLIFLKNTGILNALASPEEPKPINPLTIYPNPATHQLFVKGDVAGTFHVYSITGDWITSGKLDSSNSGTSLLVKDWSAGIYIIRTFTDSRVFTNKVVIQR